MYIPQTSVTQSSPEAPVVVTISIRTFAPPNGALRMPLGYAMLCYLPSLRS